MCPGVGSRNGRPDGYFEGPMRPVRRALFDPLSQERDFFRLHGLGFALGGLRHEVMGVFGLDALDQLALVGVARDDRVGVPGALLHGGFGQVEAQACLAHFRVGPVAAKAAGGQDRLNILVEIKALPGRDTRRSVMAAWQQDQSRGHGKSDQSGGAETPQGWIPARRDSEYFFGISDLAWMIQWPRAGDCLWIGSTPGAIPISRVSVDICHGDREDRILLGSDRQKFATWQQRLSTAVGQGGRLGDGNSGNSGSPLARFRAGT